MNATPRMVVMLVVLAMAAPRGAAAGLFDWFSGDSGASKAKPKSTSRTTPVYKPHSTNKQAEPGMLASMSGAIKRPFTTHKIASGAKSLGKPASASAKKPNASQGRTASKAHFKQGADEKPGFLRSLFIQEEPPPPRSVGEWMKLPRLDP